MLVVMLVMLVEIAGWSAIEGGLPVFRRQELFLFCAASLMVAWLRFQNGKIARIKPKTKFR